jgi:thioredoxin reductase
MPSVSIGYALLRQLRTYDGVEVRDTQVAALRADNECFQILLVDGTQAAAAKVLLATGIIDTLPPIEGIRPFYGQSVFHCPYCDAWEVRDQPLAVYGRGSGGLGLARTVRGWTTEVVLCTDGPATWSRKDRQQLDRPLRLSSGKKEQPWLSSSVASMVATHVCSRC